jgi:hypothetical protein
MSAVAFALFEGELLIIFVAKIATLSSAAMDWVQTMINE